jgi:2,4-dienoyl-CoA reductase (NADPH2)
MLGGQFNLAKRIPGKEDYQYTIDYFTAQLAKLAVTIHLNCDVKVDMLDGFDEIVIATGVHPRRPNIPGIEHAKVMTYVDAILGHKSLGDKIAIIGAGGIGVDTATKIMHENTNYYQEWGIDTELHQRGGLLKEACIPAHKKVYLLQRKSLPIGSHLGKTTGWIHRMTLRKKGVRTISGVEYIKIDDDGLHFKHQNQVQCIDVDSIIICAGQDEELDLYHELKTHKQTIHLVGGAYQARELDAKQAIEQATRLALVL